MNLSDDSARDRMIYELGNMFTAQLGLEELIPLVISKCREVLEADGVSVQLLDVERDELYFPYVSEDDPEVARRLRGMRFPADSGLAGAVLRMAEAKKSTPHSPIAAFIQKWIGKPELPRSRCL